MWAGMVVPEPITMLAAGTGVGQTFPIRAGMDLVYFGEKLQADGAIGLSSHARIARFFRFRMQNPARTAETVDDGPYRDAHTVVTRRPSCGRVHSPNFDRPIAAATGPCEMPSPITPHLGSGERREKQDGAGGNRESPRPEESECCRARRTAYYKSEP